MLPKYNVFSGKELIHSLLEYGFFEIRVKGSHVIVQKKLPDTTITIPIPLHKEIIQGTLLSIIRQ